MALFKPLKGNRSSLDSQPLHDGYAYFCVDDGTFHVDYADSSGAIKRKQINAEEAEKLTGFDISTVINDSNLEIPTSKAVFTALAAHNRAVDAHSDIRELISNIDSALDAKADASAMSDIYTKSEVDTKLSSKADSSHDHNSDYDAKGAAAEVKADMLGSIQALRDDIGNTYATKSALDELSLSKSAEIDTDIDTHSNSTSAHGDIRNSISAVQAELDEVEGLIDSKVSKLGDTMEGALVAQNNTNYSTKQVRNIFLIAEGEDLPSTSNGDIILVYS